MTSLTNPSALNDNLKVNWPVGLETTLNIKHNIKYSLREVHKKLKISQHSITNQTGDCYVIL